MKKTLSVFLLFAVCLFLSANGSGESASSEAESKVQIQILNGTTWPIPSDVDVNDNPFANQYKEGLPNIEIDWVIVPLTSLTEKVNILMAAGDMPDLVPCTDTEMVNWAESGLIVSLDEEVAQYYPNQKDYFDEATLKYAMYNGKQYRLLTPKNSLENPMVLEVRQDWLDALGLDMPETTDEVMEVMKAFTYDDPDGNGKDDTFGFSGAKNLGLMKYFFNAFDVDETFWSTVDGTIIPDIIRPEMKEALAYIREMYESGVYDKDSLAQANKQAEEKGTAGINGFISFYSWGTVSRIAPALAEKGKTLVPLAPLVGPGGKQMYAQDPGIWNRYAVTVTCENPEAPVQVVNWLLDRDDSVDYIKINGDKINCGEEGIHSVLNSAGTFLTELSRTSSPQAEYDSYRHSYRLMGGYLHVAPPLELAKTRKNGEQIRLAYSQREFSDKGVPGPVEGEYWDELKTYYDEVKMKIVTGTLPLDAFDEWVEFFYANGGQKIIDEVNGN